MPVSPRDFELYSRMTGTPMPSDPMSRMQMAPAVYDFTKNFAKKPNLLEKTGNLVKTVGKIGAYGLGLGMQQSLANEQRAMEEQLRTQAEARQAEALVTGDSNVERQKTPAEIIEDKRMARLERTSELKQQERDDKQEKAMDLLKAKKDQLNKSLDAKDPAGGVSNNPLENALNQELGTIDEISKATGENMHDYFREKDKIIRDLAQQPTTADNYNQDFVPNQTSSGLIDRKMEQGSQIADETPNVAEVLSESQDSRQSEFADPEDVQKQIESDMIGGSLGKNQLSRFLKQKGLDQALLGAVGERTTQEPLIGDDSPLLDHPDIIGGEDDSALPGGTNTSSTQDLSSFYKEMRKMDAMERNKKAIDKVVDKFKNMSPSEKQTMLGTEGMDSPNEMQGRITAAEESSNKLIDAMRSMKGDPTQEQFVEVSQAGSRAEQKIAAKQRSRGIKTPLTEKLYPTDVARTDIQVGGMVDRKTGLGKSVGISYTPMNGDTKVGFNIMSDPTKPTEVSTFDFVASPDTMKSLESREENSLGTKSFGKLFNIARQKKQGFSGIEM